MNTKRDVPASGGLVAPMSLALAAVFLCGVLAAGSQVPRALPSMASYNCFGQFYILLESVVMLGSPAQWVVALFGLCLYPALSMTSRVASSSPAEAVGSSAQSTSEPSASRGLGSHSIHLKSQRQIGSLPRPSGGGFVKRLWRVLAEGRARARKLCGQDSSLRTAVASLSRRRSFTSRSSKSEDMLSSRLSMESVLRSAQQNVEGGGGSGSGGKRGLQQQQRRRRNGSGSGDAGSGSRWQPSMLRITSGQHLAGMVPSVSSRSSVTAGKRLEILSYNGFQAVDCMSHEMTDPLFSSVRQVVTDAHLLQFGAMIGEASAELALSQAGNAAAVGPQSASLFGPHDRPELYRKGWELVVEEHKPGLHYWTWRRHLRKGLFMYKSKTVYETATTAQIMDFTYDIEFRRTWDDAMACQLAIAPPLMASTLAPERAAAAAEGVASSSSSKGPAAAALSLAEADARSSGGRSAFMYARTKFPPPMASREYTYARRCWAKPDDGGTYCISRSCAHPSPPAAGGRAVRVTDFISGYVIRSSKGIFDTASPAVEVVNVYFEDPCVPAGIVNMSVRRALWPMVQKAEAAFRDYLLTRVHGNLERPPPERPLATDSLGAAIGAPGAAAARAAAADADAASCMAGLSQSAGCALWRLHVASPYVLLFRGYMAIWRGGRGTLLSGLSCCMSLWCNATGLFFCGLGVARRGLAVAGARARSLLRDLSGAMAAAAASSGDLLSESTTCAVKSGTRQAGRALAQAMWPWEALAAAYAAGRRFGSPKGPVPLSSQDSRLQRQASDSSSLGSSRLSSHPLPGSSGTGGVKRLSIVPGAGTVADGGGAQSPRAAAAGGRRVRPGLARRCAVLAVKLAKVAGAGLLLGRAARTEAGAAQPVATAAGTAAAQRRQQQQAALGAIAQQQQRRSDVVRRAVPGQGW